MMSQNSSSIILKGFEKQSVTSVSAVEQVINRLPKHHLKGLRYIVYDPERFYQRSYVDLRVPNRGVKGAYYPDLLDAIIIHEIADRGSFKHILVHEIGHYVFDKILSPQQRHYWLSRLYPQKCFVTEYAKTNGQEDFAESYSMYFQSKLEGFYFKDKHNFISKI